MNQREENRICYTTKTEIKTVEPWKLKLQAIADNFEQWQKGNNKNLKQIFKDIDSGKITR
jgi:hypothetical protein